MLKIVLASNNPGKIAEIQAMLEGLDIELIPQSEFDIPDIEETGMTFVENAIIKARHATKHSGLPALADDSGLTVPVLNNEPGVCSSRYAGANASDQERMDKVLQELAAIKDADRAAYFQCVLVLMERENDPSPLICQGIWDGEILEAPRGKKGFGYDPIFYVPDSDCSAAELDAEEKNAVSHRGLAMEQLLEVLEEVLR